MRIRKDAKHMYFILYVKGGVLEVEERPNNLYMWEGLGVKEQPNNLYMLCHEVQKNCSKI